MDTADRPAITGRGTFEPDVRIIGASLAATCAFVVAIVGWLLAPDSGWMVGAFGLPATTVLAWRRSRQVVAAGTKRQVASLAAGLGIRTIFVTFALLFVIVVGVFAVAGLTNPEGGAFLWLPIIIAWLLVAMVVLGALLALIVIPVAVGWAALLRLATH